MNTYLITPFRIAVLAVGFVLVSGSASAASLDLRHEYKWESARQAARIRIGGSIGKHSLSAELKFAGATDEAVESLQRDDSELGYEYQYEINTQLRLQPGMLITWGNGRAIFKPQIRIQYKLKSGIVTKLRYRHEIFVYTENTDPVQRSKITGNLDYNWNAFQIGFEANYLKGLDDQVLYDGGDTSWDYNFKIGYKKDNWKWRPYVEIGNVPVSSVTADRQLRTRVGVTYYF